jgi:hypothetical protein
MIGAAASAIPVAGKAGRGAQCPVVAEALGLTWPTIDMDAAEVSLEWQLQRVGRSLIHKRRTKTDGSTDILPLPAICLAALKLQKDRQDGMRSRDQDS